MRKTTVSFTDEDFKRLKALQEALRKSSISDTLSSLIIEASENGDNKVDKTQTQKR